MSFLSSIVQSELELPQEAQLILRRIGKRDTGTKLKALADFADALRAHDGAWAASLLANWTVLFGRLGGDASAQVREAACAALRQLVCSAGRKALAPHLKQLITPWLCLRMDEHAEVRRAAIAAFDESFTSPTKYVDALVFCRDEIASGLADRALAHAEKEGEDSHSRRASSALRCAAHLILASSRQAAPSANSPESLADEPSSRQAVHVEKISRALRDHLFSDEMWNLGEISAPPVRAATYALALVLLQARRDAPEMTPRCAAAAHLGQSRMRISADSGRVSRSISRTWRRPSVDRSQRRCSAASARLKPCANSLCGSRCCC